MPLSSDQSPLNYSLEYRYENPEKPHQATRIGGYYYAYDANGNLAVESETPIAASGAGAAPQMTRQGDVRIVEEAWGYDHQKEQSSSGYRRDFSWDSENRLKEVKSGTTITRFLYDAAGERTGKIGERGETLYFNAWFTSREDGALYRNSKHIFVGSHRAVTRLNADTGGTWEAEDLTTYYYHPDHLGSVSVVSDRRGDPYERIEYTPYGEMWQEVRHDGNTAASKYIPYRFTAKEWDKETGLYYHGARYYEPRISRWISADPAGFALSRPMNARGEPRRGYSIVEAANWYSYVSNNPVKYVDPTGLFTLQVGIGGTLGGGSGVTGEIGVGFSGSRDKGIDIGIYARGAIGAYVGTAATIDVSLTVSAADELVDMRGETLTVGGSGSLSPLGIPLSFGAETNVPIAKEEIDNSSLTGSLSFGVGTPGEGHTIYADTKLISIKGILIKVWHKAESMSEQLLDKIAKLPLSSGADY